jgi:hypothetical protein
MNANYTQHASRRLQQRGIRRAAIELLMAFGSVEFDHMGACIYHLDKRSRLRIELELGRDSFRQVEALNGLYVVVSGDGDVITAGHRQRRILHDRKPGSFPWRRMH